MDDSKRWFILDSGQVKGPFSLSEIEARLVDAVEPMLWGRGLSEWLHPMEWRKALERLKAGSPIEAVHEEPSWRFRLAGVEHGPYLYADLLAALRKLQNPSDVELAHESLEGWREIYAIQKVADELGITRRAHPRVPIMGTLKTEGSKAGPFEARVSTISEGGLGLLGAPPLTLGDKFKGVLNSPNLYMEIPCSCEVVFVGSDGQTGLRFTQLPTEALAAIIEYVRRFKGPHSP